MDYKAYCEWTDYPLSEEEALPLLVEQERLGDMWVRYNYEYCLACMVADCFASNFAWERKQEITYLSNDIFIKLRMYEWD